jgi:hypothetical protein
MPVDQDRYRLVHYTNSPEVVGSILRTGFLLVPNKRHLINALLGEEIFTEREPQEFGMVSFTQLPIAEATSHRERFGAFGVVVSWEWAFSHDAQRVIYVDEGGPVASTFAWLFRLGKQELDRATGHAPSPMTLANKAMAFTKSSTLYARLLTLYEYMEPERNSGQVEWRVVNKIPQYHDTGKPKDELVRELLEASKIWKNFGSIQLSARDVHAFICPRGAKPELQKNLPDSYRDVPILTYRPEDQVSRLRRACDRALFAHRGRERVVEIEVERELPADRIWIGRNANGAYHLPEAGRIWGGGLYQDELASAIRVSVQYQSTTGFFCELVMPIRGALYLLNILKAMQHDSGLDYLNPSNDAGR